MKRKIIFIVLVVSALTLGGCVSRGTIPAADIEPLIEVVGERHDAYVEADESLSEAQKGVALRSTALLRKVVQEARDGND